MMRFTGIILLLICSVSLLPAQTFTDSNLPIVVINTDGGVSVPDEPKVLATMKLIYRGPGQRNYLTDVNDPRYLNYNGRIGIEKRGSSSQDSPKKSYGFTTLMADGLTNNNVSLMGMPPENDWILGGMVFDTAMVRDYIADNLARAMGQYASRTSYCEVVINNVYRGLYLLQEKIKADDNRVDVIKLTTSDNNLPNLSGGYITKADKTTGGDPVAWYMYSWTGGQINYIHDLPDPVDATYFQTQYIKNEFFKLETAAKNKDASVTNGYPAIIEVQSFIDYMLLTEFASNSDGYTYSTYFHKDRNGKLRAGPVWDFDLTLGNDLFMWGLDRSKTNVWQFEYGGNDGSTFWRDLFYSSQFKCYLARRFNELTLPGQPLNQAVLSAFIDQAADSISEAVTRDYTKWSKQGSHSQRITAIKSFIAARSAWMTENLGSFAACSNVTLPELVITRIMYHPVATTQYPDEDDLEYLEIRNHGTVSVSLGGIGFLGTGLVYTFPPSATLEPGQSVILASNSAAFMSRYGFVPFGQFSRHLSNSGENLLLADAFGNVIDQVFYSDSLPWPAADGNGYHIRLKDPGFDNALASNWIASNEVITGLDDIFEGDGIVIWPNPVRDELQIRSEREMINISVYDLQGRLIDSFSCSGTYTTDDVRHLAPGTYLVRITTVTGTFTRKIVKE